MFTGIVEEQGEVLSLAENNGSATLTVRTRQVAVGIVDGASVAVDGVCLTVVGQGGGGLDGALTFDVMGETLRRSGIGDLRPGDHVNLERAARVDGRLDGHIVQGHVDGTGRIAERTPAGEWETVRIQMPGTLARYVAEKGSVTVQGVSLTVSAVGADWFEVGLIPATLRATTLGTLAVGATVNLEVDVLAKYTERLLAARTEART